jgi:hypothetical protein
MRSGIERRVLTYLFAYFSNIRFFIRVRKQSVNHP